MTLSLLALLASLGCRDKQPMDSADTSVETDADTDADADTDTDSDTDVQDVDADGDGFTPQQGDCDDTDPSVYPGAADTWYDGVDSDCSGDDDYDQDLDGDASIDGGGGDCEDLNPEINSSAIEVQDALDNNCDGVADEGFLSYGDVLVTEVMLDAVAVGDTTGEWFEVYNTTNQQVNLLGLTISSDDGDRFDVAYNLKIGAGKYRVLGVEKDANLNGGVEVYYSYSRDKFKLDNGGDSFILDHAGTTLFELSINGNWPIEAGRSIALDPEFLNASTAGQPGYWCSATSELLGGDYGTPGAENDWCSSVDHDGDGTSEDEGDCDDEDADVNAEASESFDGKDNDCNGSVDDILASQHTGGQLTGGNYSYLGGFDSFAVADIDGDGASEFLISDLGLSGTRYYNGNVYVLEGADHTSYSGAVSSTAESTLSGASYGYASAVSRSGLGDNTGDGVLDVGVAGISYVWGDYSDEVFSLYDGTISGSLDPDDAQVTFSGSLTPLLSQAVMPAVASNGDIDGDGTAEIIFGAPSGTDSGVYVFDLDGDAGDIELGDADGVWTNPSDAYVGYAVISADVDGDGYDDILTAGLNWVNGTGAVYILLGGSLDSGAIGSDYDLRITGSMGDRLGVGGGLLVADVDADSTDDLVIASPTHSEVYVFSDVANLSATDTGSADITLSGSDYFGAGMTAGDLDNDGTGDLVVSSPGFYGGTSWQSQTTGSVWFFSGDTLNGASTLSDSDADGSIEGEDAGDLFGSSLLAGDLDDDGDDELAVSAPMSSQGQGAAYIFDLN